MQSRELKQRRTGKATTMKSANGTAT